MSPPRAFAQAVPSVWNAILLKVKVFAARWSLTLCDPMDCSLPGASVHEILQASILATGGTSIEMAKHLEALTVVKDGVEYPVKVKEFVFLADLSFLHGKELLEEIAPVYSLISF